MIYIFITAFLLLIQTSYLNAQTLSGHKRLTDQPEISSPNQAARQTAVGLVRACPSQSFRRAGLAGEERREIRKEKIDRFLLPAMREYQIDCWIVLTREYVQDPIARDLGAGAPTARAALLFTVDGDRLGRTAIVASYDVDAPSKSGIYDTVISYRREGLLPHLQQFIDMLKPKRIGINYSKDSPLADGLTLSMFNYLKEAAGPSYDESKPARNQLARSSRPPDSGRAGSSLPDSVVQAGGSGGFVSAEPVIVAWRGKKTPKEIEILRTAVAITEAILRDALASAVIKPSKTTELDVARFIKEKMKTLGVTESWEPSGCPSINTGISRGHSEPTDSIIQPGHVLTIDFGINLDGYCTDIQRTAYILKPGENFPPSHIQKMWETNLKSIEEGFKMMRVGNSGNDVDKVCRQVIVSAGYKEYPHAAGHPIGYIAHEVGPLLGPDWHERYGKKVFLRLEPNQVFALEPAVSSESKELGGEIRIGIEENILITEQGPEWLSTPQKEIILIPSER